VENVRAERVACLNAGLIVVNMLIVGCIDVQELIR